METFVQTKMRPVHNMTKTAAVQQKQAVAQKPRPHQEALGEKKTSVPKPKGQGLLPAIITTLLLIPLVLVISIGVFICWRKNSMYDRDDEHLSRPKEQLLMQYLHAYISIAHTQIICIICLYTENMWQIYVAKDFDLHPDRHHHNRLCSVSCVVNCIRSVKL